MHLPKAQQLIILLLWQHNFTNSFLFVTVSHNLLYVGRKQVKIKTWLEWQKSTWFNSNYSLAAECKSLMHNCQKEKYETETVKGNVNSNLKFWYCYSTQRFPLHPLSHKISSRCASSLLVLLNWHLAQNFYYVICTPTTPSEWSW